MLTPLSGYTLKDNNALNFLIHSIRKKKLAANIALKNFQMTLLTMGHVDLSEMENIPLYAHWHAHFSILNGIL